MQSVMNPGGMQGLMQAANQEDGMQRLAIMLAMMVLGSYQVYGCQAREAQEVSEVLPIIIPGLVSRGHGQRKDRGGVSGDGLSHGRLDETEGTSL